MSYKNHKRVTDNEYGMLGGTHKQTFQISKLWRFDSSWEVSRHFTQYNLLILHCLQRTGLSTTHPHVVHEYDAGASSSNATCSNSVRIFCHSWISCCFLMEYDAWLEVEAAVIEKTVINDKEKKDISGLCLIQNSKRTKWMEWSWCALKMLSEGSTYL